MNAKAKVSSPLCIACVKVALTNFTFTTVAHATNTTQVLLLSFLVLKTLLDYHYVNPVIISRDGGGDEIPSFFFITATHRKKHC